MTAEEIKSVISRITMNIFGKKINIIIDFDQKYSIYYEENGETIGRQYLQLEYEDICHDTGVLKTWRGRKWLLSEYMTDDEIIKTGYAAFEALIKHEIMEGYTVDGIKLFNPHVHYEALLESSTHITSRDKPINYTK